MNRQETEKKIIDKCYEILEIMHEYGAGKEALAITVSDISISISNGKSDHPLSAYQKISSLF